MISRYRPTRLKASKNLGIRQNVTFNVLDQFTGNVIQSHSGHNSATNSLLWGIGHHLIGDFFANQPSGISAGYPMLSNYVPRYISLGTMGLINQNQDSKGLPAGIGDSLPTEGDAEYEALVAATAQAKEALDEAIEALEGDCQYWPACEECKNTECGDRIAAKKAAVESAKAAYQAAYDNQVAYVEEYRFTEYMAHRPGYGADGYDEALNNGRPVFGLGPLFKDRSNRDTTIACELISDTFPRSDITFRDIIPEFEAELPKTIDVVFSAMISTGALSQFRPEGQDYIFITEAGLWSKRPWENSGENGLLAAYRIGPPNEANWDMSIPENREILKRNVLRVGKNQVVQVVWKIQIGSIDEFTSVADLRHEYFGFY